MADFDTDLTQQTANYAALTPIDHLLRAAEVYGDQLAIVHGSLRQNWRDTHHRCCQLAAALRQQGVSRNTTVAVLLPNTPAMVEAHFGVPMSGGVLCTLNIRLDVEAMIFCLQHGEAKVLIADTEFASEVAAIKQAMPDLYVIQVNDLLGPEEDDYGHIEYETFLNTAEDLNNWVLPENEWDAIALNYTSGTTGDPKGVVYHHRGAMMNSLSNIMDWDMPKFPVYLWTLPMFHCNGWCFPWTIAARAGVNVCLRRFDPKVCFELIKTFGVTHYSAAPIVHAGLANAPDELKQGVTHLVKGSIAGAAPPEAVLAAMEKMDFEITHVYGLTEVYGPASVCVQRPEWLDLDISGRAAQNARQGVRSHLQDGLSVLDPITMEAVPHDGVSIGELMFRGNIVMKGYLKNPRATQEAFADGWFHTGDLGVVHPDGYVQIKDRSKDIIISGGENISSIEVEDVIYKHPQVLSCAVVAVGDEKWGEVPFAFVELRDGVDLTVEALREYCREHLARYKVPKHFSFSDIPKTSTGKIQKFALRNQAKAIVEAATTP
ncbi:MULTISPECIES: acyl-CoA synthetase [Vitreoscilla]|uniref:Acyl-CoA synthetase n=1 Tax=Vitreoscilla stercoraria TaxID=61 RepID=A0ABY4E879_VITST|nr:MULTISPECIES: acyl-CoA synthetase [Vitreoscilla]AUZ04704.1 AMP-dependent synthetase/ligase [Vitreoscilla sp. C1]UOO91610.1 acyl-CoA synthetase [Vitreoscilla stercoraria]